VDHALSAGPQALGPAQRHRLLGDAQALRWMRTRIPVRLAHPHTWLPEALPPASRRPAAQRGAQAQVLNPAR
jgi:hypothetical protein